MFTTLVAVIAALAVGHMAPSMMAALRNWRWFGHWLDWLRARDNREDSGRFTLAVAVAPCVLLVGIVQWLLLGCFHGVASLLLGVLALALCWGPRDLDRDVEAVLDADDTVSHDAAVKHLQAAGGSLRKDEATLIGATLFNALRRWFAPLFWFLLLGPFGAVLYRLLAQAVEGPQSASMSEAGRQSAAPALAMLEWPVAQLMALSMALVGNFDTVFQAWRRAGSSRWTLDLSFMVDAARASVGMELAEEAEPAGQTRRTPQEELHPAMSLVWRILLLWLVILALLVIASWMR